MAIDMEKYRKNSSFNKNGGGNDSERLLVTQQATDAFEQYQRTSPNTFKIFINDDTTPVLGTLQDVSDLEIRADTKWMSTSLKHRIYAGDIITFQDRKWICIYDKLKNTQNSLKVKIQPCTYGIQVPQKNINGDSIIYVAHSILMTYLTDTRDFKQPFPTETGTTFITMQYNPNTAQIKAESRIWLYDRVFEVGGVDFTNIDFYNHKGFYKLTARPSLTISEYDNKELGICDYYKFFPKSITEPIVPELSNVTLLVAKKNIGTQEKLTIQAVVTTNEVVDFTFWDGNLGCVLSNVQNNECILESGNKMGIVYVMASVKGNPLDSAKVRIVIN